MVAQQIPLSFQIYKGSQLVRTEKLIVSDQIRIGKVSSAQLKLDEEGVSRMHAEITVSGADQIHIIDLGSSKGTFVNGQKIQKQALRSGDEIKIGEVRLVLTIGQPIVVEQKTEAARSEAPKYVAPRYVMPAIDLSQVERAGVLSAEAQMVFQGAPLQVLNLNPARRLFVGDATGCEFFVPVSVLGVSKLPLLWTNEDGSEFFFCFPANAQGSVTFEGGKMISLSELVGSGEAKALPGFDGVCALRLVRPASCTLALSNGSELRVKAVAAPKRMAAGKKWDLPIIAYTGGSAAAMGLLLGLVFSVSPDARSLDLTQFGSNNQMVKFQVKPPEEKKEEIPNWLKNDKKDPEGDADKAHKGPEGEMGKKNAANKNGLYKLQGDAQNMTLARNKAEELANNVGILSIVGAGGTKGSPFASVFGQEVANGNDAATILGGLVGDRPDEADGFGGLGLRGAGLGGFGTGENTLGLGNDGVQGTAGKGTNGKPWGQGGDPMGTYKAKGPDPVEFGTAEPKGCLDKASIQRVVKRASNGIKFCYEQALQTNSSLAGRLKIYFVITPNGSVSTTNIATSLQADVDACVARKISQLSFPTPPNCGLTEVTYPFTFRAAGD